MFPIDSNELQILFKLNFNNVGLKDLVNLIEKQRDFLKKSKKKPMKCERENEWETHTHTKYILSVFTKHSLKKNDV